MSKVENLIDTRVEYLAADLVRDKPEHADAVRAILGTYRRGQMSAEAALEQLERLARR
jgi:hypothetical protein